MLLRKYLVEGQGDELAIVENAAEGWVDENDMPQVYKPLGESLDLE